MPFTSPRMSAGRAVGWSTLPASIEAAATALLPGPLLATVTAGAVALLADRMIRARRS